MFVTFQLKYFSIYFAVEIVLKTETISMTGLFKVRFLKQVRLDIINLKQL